MATEAPALTPLWGDGLTYDAQMLRFLVTNASHAQVGQLGPLSVRSGVHPGVGDPLKVSASGGMDVTINPGFATVQGSQNSLQGAYVTGLSTPATLTVATSNPVNPRRDAVIIAVTDAGNANSKAEVKIVTGTPAPTPSDPALPHNSLLLARVTVRPGSSALAASDVLDLRRYTVATGGVIPGVFGESITGVYDGQVRYDTDVKSLRVWDGAAWQQLAATSGPRGIIAKAFNTVGSGGWRDTGEVVQQVISFVPFVAGRRYKITSTVRVGNGGSPNQGGDLVALSHKINGVRKSRFEFVTTSAAAGIAPDCYTYETLIDDAQTGQFTVTLEAINLSGNGYHQLLAGNGIRCAIWVEDIGSQA